MAPLVENSSDVTAAPRYRSAIGPRSSSTSTRIRGRSMLALAAAAVGNQLPAISAFIPTAPSPSCPASAASTTAALVRSNRERERRELVELNDRFANYVERVRFLEAQNKKLKLEVDGLRRQIDGANGHSRLKEMYETELNEARALVDQTARQKNEVELRSRKLEDEASDLRDQLESLHLVRSGERKTLEGLSRQIADNEAELGLVHRRLKDTDEEYKRQRSETQKLSAQIQATMSELYQETALKLELQNEKQSLEEEISFLRQIHAQELEEILANNAAASSEVIDPSLFFKHELANAIRDIRSEYEALNQQQRQEIENWYRLKVAEIVNESRRPAESSIGRLRDEEELRQLREQVTVSKKDAGNLRIRNRDLQTRIQELEQVVDQERRQGDRERELRDRELDELRSRFEQVLAEYDELVSSKTTLDSEIAIYRKLLEGEEHRNQEPPFESVVEPSAAAEPRPPAASSSSSSGIGSDLRIGLDRARTSESAIGLDLSSSTSSTSLGEFRKSDCVVVVVGEEIRDGLGSEKDRGEEEVRQRTESTEVRSFVAAAERCLSDGSDGGGIENLELDQGSSDVDPLDSDDRMGADSDEVIVGIIESLLDAVDHDECFEPNAAETQPTGDVVSVQGTAVDAEDATHFAGTLSPESRPMVAADVCSGNGRESPEAGYSDPVSAADDEQGSESDSSIVADIDGSSSSSGGVDDNDDDEFKADLSETSGGDSCASDDSGGGDCCCGGGVVDVKLSAEEDSSVGENDQSSSDEGSVQSFVGASELTDRPLAAAAFDDVIMRRHKSVSSTVDGVAEQDEQGHGSPCSVQSRTAFKRSAKGPISLTECSKHGHFISISNASYKKTKDLNGWYVTQQSSQGSEIKFVFDKSVKIEPNKKIKLFSEKAVLEEMVVVVREKDQQQDDSFVICAGIPNWLTEEDQVVTKLYDSEDQEKASYTQTRSSSSQ